MDKVKQFRELTRELDCHLENINRSDCCQCSVNESQCFLVVEIGRNPGICIKDLAHTVHQDKSAVSRSIEELVQRGYVVREPSKTDRRCVVLDLTSEGRAHFEKIGPHARRDARVVDQKVDAAEFRERLIDGAFPVRRAGVVG